MTRLAAEFDGRGLAVIWLIAPAHEPTDPAQSTNSGTVRLRARGTVPSTRPTYGISAEEAERAARLGNGRVDCTMLAAPHARVPSAQNDAVPCWLVGPHDSVGSHADDTKQQDRARAVAGLDLRGVAAFPQLR